VLIAQAGHPLAFLSAGLPTPAHLQGLTVAVQAMKQTLHLDFDLAFELAQPRFQDLAFLLSLLRARLALTTIIKGNGQHHAGLKLHSGAKSGGILMQIIQAQPQVRIQLSRFLPGAR